MRVIHHHSIVRVTCFFFLFFNRIPHAVYTIVCVRIVAAKRAVLIIYIGCYLNYFQLKIIVK